MKVTPERIMQLGNGYWASAILGAAVRCRLFTHIEAGARSVEAIAARAGLSIRGAQALLDGLSGLGLVQRAGGVYANGEDAAAFLVEGKPSFVGAVLRDIPEEMLLWAQLPEVARTGVPAAPETLELPDNPLWHELVPWIARNSIPVATAAAAELRIADAGPISILDVGGGSGMFSIVLLEHNPQASATQLDWPGVNRIARDFAARHAVAERFHTVDGDLHAADFGEGAHDVGIYSNVAHQESAEDNAAIFCKLRRAIKPGGVLVVNDFVLDGDRHGNPFASLFHANMLLRTRGGATWCEPDYRRWLADAGFAEAKLVPTSTPATLIIAR